MNLKQIKKIFKDTAYERMGGSEQELQCANYIASLLKEEGLNAEIEAFEVPMANINSVSLSVDGKKNKLQGLLLLWLTRANRSPLLLARRRQVFT